MDMKPTVRAEVRGFVVENFLFGTDDGVLHDETSLLQAGIIDSTGILELVTHIEETYQIHVDEEEMIPQNFDSLTNLALFVTRKKNNMER